MNNESGCCGALDIRQRADFCWSPWISGSCLKSRSGTHILMVVVLAGSGSAVRRGRHLGCPFSRGVGWGGGRPGVDADHGVRPVIVVLSCLL